MKKKPGARPTVKANKSKSTPLPKPYKRRMNALDKAIMERREVPIKGRKKLPPDYDVILPDMGYTKPTKKKPPRKIQGR